jgi:apolipoprotein N-acyltransferase
MKNEKFLNAVWLVLGLTSLFFAGGDQPIGIMAWLVPVFFLRFFRDTHALKAYPITLVGMIIVKLIANRGMMPFPSFKILLFYTALGSAMSLLPYLFDGLLNRRLMKGLKVFIFPSLAVAIPFLFGSHGTWGAKANLFEDLALLQLISITGTSGVSFFINWTASMVNTIWEQRGEWKRVRILAVVFLAVFTLVYGFGFLRLRSNYQPRKVMMAAGIVHEPSQRADLTAAFTQIIRSDPKKRDELEPIRKSMKNLYLKTLSDSKLLADAGFQMVVWYEGAVVVFQEDEKQLVDLAADKAREKGIYLGLGLAVYQNQSRSSRRGIQPLFKNKLILISPCGEIQWEYAKGILVPGMEAAITIPGDRIMKVSRTDQRITGAICYELDFPGHIRQAVKLNATLILAPSNDWDAIKHTHARMARLRAIENGISILRPVNGGISIAVDPYGRILENVDNTRYMGIPLTAAIPMDPIPTIYSRWGDFFKWLCLLLSLLCLSVGIGSWIRSRFEQNQWSINRNKQKENNQI